MSAGDAEYGVLCADHHPGYSQPIGGAIAYEGYVSPSGVGYDIGCVAVAEPVLCSDGASRPIERAQDPLCVDAVGAVRPVAPFLGVVARGRRATVTVTLGNHRSVTVTPDHQVRTELGWRRADELREGDRVLCPVFIGLAARRRLPGSGPAAACRIRERRRASPDARESGLAVHEQGPDAEDLMADMRSARARSRRAIVECDRTAPSRTHVYANDRSVFVNSCRRLAARSGRKAGQWRGSADAILADAGVRAGVLPGGVRFSRDEHAAARRRDAIPNLAIKQRGIDAIEGVVGLLESLRFRVGLSRSDGENWVAQILGGEEEKIRFIETVGFSRARDKRRAGASAVATAWERSRHLSSRMLAQSLVRQRMACGEQVRHAVAAVASRERPDAGDRPAPGVSAGRASSCAELVSRRHGDRRVRVLGSGERRARG